MGKKKYYVKFNNDNNLIKPVPLYIYEFKINKNCLLLLITLTYNTYLNIKSSV